MGMLALWEEQHGENAWAKAAGAGPTGRRGRRRRRGEGGAGGDREREDVLEEVVEGGGWLMCGSCGLSAARGKKRGTWRRRSKGSATTILGLGMTAAPSLPTMLVIMVLLLSGLVGSARADTKEESRQKLALAVFLPLLVILLCICGGISYCYCGTEEQLAARRKRQKEGWCSVCFRAEEAHVELKHDHDHDQSYDGDLEAQGARKSDGGEQKSNKEPTGGHRSPHPAL